MSLIKSCFFAHPSSDRSFARPPSTHTKSHLTCSPLLLCTPQKAFIRTGCSTQSSVPLVYTATTQSSHSARLSKPIAESEISPSRLIEIIIFIGRLPGIIAGLLKKEEQLIDSIEDDIDEIADGVKMGSKAIEELADGIEKVADAIENKKLEKVAKTVAKDAKRVEEIMDDVKEKAKVVHDELQEVASSLEEPMHIADAKVAKVHGQTAKDYLSTKMATTDNLELSKASPNGQMKDSPLKVARDLVELWKALHLAHILSLITGSSEAIPANSTNKKLLVYSMLLIKALTVLAVLVPLMRSLHPMIFSSH